MRRDPDRIRLENAIDNDDTATVKAELGAHPQAHIGTFDADGRTLLTRAVDVDARGCFDALVEAMSDEHGEDQGLAYMVEDAYNRTPAGAILTNRRSHAWLTTLLNHGWDPTREASDAKTNARWIGMSLPRATRPSGLRFTGMFPFALARQPASTPPLSRNEVETLLDKTPGGRAHDEAFDETTLGYLLDVMLETAAACGHLTNVRHLIELGADPKRETGQFAVLVNAHLNPGTDVIDELVQNGASLVKDIDGNPHGMLRGLLGVWPTDDLARFLNRYAIRPDDLTCPGGHARRSVVADLAKSYLPHDNDDTGTEIRRKLGILLDHSVDDKNILMHAARANDNGCLLGQLLDQGMTPERYGGDTLRDVLYYAILNGAQGNIELLHDRGYDVIGQELPNPEGLDPFFIDPFSFAQNHSADPDGTQETLARLQEKHGNASGAYEDVDVYPQKGVRPF